ncbi:hypothetical protein TNCV_1589871 [Trichonephila clavipes]|uniref:Uncharacterized protein n=1 Tax=Trichonephila clavipes TaxID=2585209 RepID=A0A8X6UV18_TRICX|nr:hypothetical protein TNCV_1589871 [Trichonephila clavipes]
MTGAMIDFGLTGRDVLKTNGFLRMQVRWVQSRIHHDSTAEQQDALRMKSSRAIAPCNDYNGIALQCCHIRNYEEKEHISKENRQT